MGHLNATRLQSQTAAVHRWSRYFTAYGKEDIVLEHTQFRLVESCLSVCSLVSSTPFMFKSVKHDKKLKKKKKRTENSREELPVDSLSSSEAPSEQAFAFFFFSDL